MLVAEKISNTVKGHAPAAICDKCIVAELGLTAHAHSAQITAALGTTSDFTRERGNCVVCKNERTVIYANRT